MTLETRPPPAAAAPLVAALADVVARLESLQGDAPAGPARPIEVPGLTDLARIFGLDAAAADLVLCAATCEIEPGAGAALGRLGAAGTLTPALAQRLCGPDIWAALAPSAPLRHWRLIELAGNGPLHARPLMLDERVLDHLLDRAGADARLAGLVRPLVDAMPLTPLLRAEADRLGRALCTDGPPPVLGVEGASAELRHAVIAEAAGMAGAALLRLDAADIPGTWTERHAAALYLDRELALSRSVLLIELADAAAEGPAARALAERLVGPVALCGAEVALPEREPGLRCVLPQPDRGERRSAWRTALGTQAPDALVDGLATQFCLAPRAIRSVAAEIRCRQTGPGDTSWDATMDAAADPLPGAPGGASVWAAARLRAGGALDGLAERIEARVGWDDLVLPADTLGALRELAAQQRHAWRVTEDWGWADRGDRGLGTAALFAGASGTGKTLAAEVIAAELHLDLYRIDLSRVVSKYIGETEKNLSRIFAAAETGGAVLLFDEADALFGKRSEVKDSHDRYANVEVSYLLQRMEAYRGLAILTTNQRSAVDRAFLRRLRQVVVFPFPDAQARAEIWARVFPPKTPLDGIDPAALSRLGIAGGAIRSIALNAAYLAAADGAPVGRGHVLRAARREYAKLEKPFAAAEAAAFR